MRYNKIFFDNLPNLIDYQTSISYFFFKEPTAFQNSFDARDEFGIDLAQSHMVGDKRVDLECGWNAGVRQSFLVRTGYGAEWEAKLGEDAERAVVVDNAAAAARN